jgi:hypothetical protein
MLSRFAMDEDCNRYTAGASLRPNRQTLEGF